MSELLDAHGRTEAERASLREAVARANKDAQDNWDDPKWHRDMAQQMSNTIYRGFESQNLLSLMADVSNEPLDGRVFVKETRGLRAFWVARGGYIEASNLQSNVMELPRDTVGFHVYEEEEKLMTNFAETQRNVVQLGTKRLDAAVNLRVISLFQSAVDNSSPYYVSGTGLSLTALDSAIRSVRDESESYEVTIIGRETMTGQIVDQLSGNSTFPAFLPGTNEDLLRGILGSYKGAKIVTLTNFADDNRIPFFPANELYVVARDAAKFAFWGGLMQKEYVEQNNWYWHFLAKRDFGGLVHRPERIRRIVDDSIDAYTAKIS